MHASVPGQLPCEVRLHSRGWQSAGDESLRVSVVGHAWLDGVFLQGRTLARRLTERFRQNGFPRDLTSVAAAMNGCFAFVIETPDVVHAATDRLRSVPLFYGRAAGRSLLSDSAVAVRAFTGDAAPDPVALGEFLLTAYVTGNETFFPAVKQVRAGEAVIFRAESAPETTRYYRFIPANRSDTPRGDFVAALEALHADVFRRLLASAGDRRIVLSLSGGRDSRLIAAMLKKLGAKNVLCFSFGRRNNWESRISREVAQRLGYPWHFVHYTWRKWRRWRDCGELRRFMEFSGNLCSRPHYLDLGALFEMKEEGVLHEDDLLVSGHSGDFLAGSHIPPVLAAGGGTCPDRIAATVLRKHYIQWAWGRETSPDYAVMAGRAASHFEGMDLRDRESAVAAYECWDCEERQAKYIVNSVRTFDFCGFEWRLPFWDHGLMDFWAGVPLELRVNKKLYDGILDNGLFRELGVAGFSRNAIQEMRSRPPNRLAAAVVALEEFLSVRTFQLTRGELGCYTLADRVEAWKMYNSRFGKGGRSLPYITHDMPLGTAAYLALALQSDGDAKKV
ncbi:MAG: hypothetical protein FJ224_02330 [Lentisphaerae bacterium]|nr:hypothetical protein [Lentisphaerota bacterium]